MTRSRRGSARLVALLAAVTVVLAAGCAAPEVTASGVPGAVGDAAAGDAGQGASGTAQGLSATSALPAPYAHVRAGDVQGVARQAKPLVYVPDQRSGSVQVIDPRTYAVVDRFTVGRSPEHVVPSHDLGTLWVNSDAGNSMTPIDPTTGKPGTTLPVADPYNLYFSPDGSAALVMAERLRRVDVRNPHTMALERSLPVPFCAGLNHADYTADLRTFVASCEFGGKLLVIDANATVVKKVIDLNVVATPGATSPDMARSMGGPKAGLAPGATSMPQDVRLTPDGRFFLVADMLRNGVWVVSTSTFSVVRFIRTGLGAHGIYPSRDASSIYVSNRDEGTISVLDAASLTQTALWTIPGGGSPDMGGVSADGTELWMSGRYNATVYVFDTKTGRVTHRITVDAGPHGLLVWPQPGRFSLGHTGNMR